MTNPVNAHPAEVREAALALYLEHGPAEAARLCGIPSGTIRSWAVTHGVQRTRSERTAAGIEAAQRDRQLVREEVRELLIQRVLDCLLRMDQPHHDYRGSGEGLVKVTWDQAPADAWRSYAIAAGVLLDKFRLEMGESTGRQEIASDAAVDIELRRMVEEWRRNILAE